MRLREAGAPGHPHKLSYMHGDRGCRWRRVLVHISRQDETERPHRAKASRADLWAEMGYIRVSNCKSDLDLGKGEAAEIGQHNATNSPDVDASP